MNKTTKGALAAGAAVVLLTGGAGTLAFWTDSSRSPAAPASTRHHEDRTDATVGTCANKAWVLDSAALPAGPTFAPATEFLVPG